MPEIEMDDGRPRLQPFSREERASLRRHAVQLAAQLPEDRRQALFVIDEVRTLLLDFLERDDDQPPPLRLVSASQD
jgi:hypothetical protein